MNIVDEHHNNGQLRSRRTFNKCGNEHSFHDQASFIEYDKAGNVMLSLWKNNGIPHRCETLGPAVIHEDKGNQFWKIYIKMGVTSRLPEFGPAVSLTNQSTKEYTETWVLDDGTVLRTVKLDKDGIKISEMTFDYDGKLNSLLEGPHCSYMMFDRKKNIKIEKYHIHGVEFTKEQILLVYDLLHNYCV